MIPRAMVVFMIAALESAAFAAPSAEELFAQGQTSFDNDDYASAVAKWNESYRLSREPELLFMIGQALENDGRCAEALATYRRFIAMAPGSEHRSLAEKFARELMPKCDAAKTAPRENQSSENPQHPRQDRDRVEDDKDTNPAGRMKLAGLVVGGAGIVSIAISFGFGYHASMLSDEVERACTTANPCDWSTVKSKDASGHLQTTLGWTFGALGAAALVGGAALYYFGGRNEGVAVAPVTRSRESGAVITWRTRW